MKDEDWKLLDRKALRVIRLSLVDFVSSNIHDQNTTKGIMDALENLYEKTLSF